MSDVVSVLCLTAVNLSLGHFFAPPEATGALGLKEEKQINFSNLWTPGGTAVDEWSLSLRADATAKRGVRHPGGRPSLPSWCRAEGAERGGGIGRFIPFRYFSFWQRRGAICQPVGRSLKRGRPSKAETPPEVSAGRLKVLAVSLGAVYDWQ
jgi:hypothetical protein